MSMANPRTLPSSDILRRSIFDLNNSTVNEFVMIRDLLRGVHYVEISVMTAWYGTEVHLSLGNVTISLIAV